MSDMQRSSTAPSAFWIVTSAGLAWSLFGAFQFVTSLQATQASLQATGLTAQQAEVMLGYPGWMTAAFAIGVFGGVVGCILLAMRNRLAVPVFALSLAGYVVLYIGDITQGVFAALGTPQVVILTLVVAIAGGLLWYARRLDGAGALR